MTKPPPPPVPYAEHLRLRKAYAALYALHFVNEEVSSLSAPKQEVTMTKLQRMKQKYPTAYKQFVKKMGRKQAHELFRNIVEEKQ